MVLCYFCDNTLYGERTQVCSSITPYSNVPYQEKIVELMGDEFVVIVTPADHMCMKCTSLLNYMDKLENDLKLVKSRMMSYVQKKYVLFPPDQAVRGVEAYELEQGQRKVPSGLTVGVSPIVTTAVVVTPVPTPLKLLKTQQFKVPSGLTVGVFPTLTTAAIVTPIQTPLKLLKTQHHLALTQQEIITYHCGHCTFQSIELKHVRFHIRIHMNKKEPGKPILNQAEAKLLSPVMQQKKRVYRCQVCSLTFHNLNNCLVHIDKNHNQPTPSTSNRVNKKFNILTNLHVVQEEENENSGAREETEYSQEDKTVKEAKLKKKPELEQEEADQETTDSVEKEVDEDNANMENKTGDMDIESTLVAY